MGPSRSLRSFCLCAAQQLAIFPHKRRGRIEKLDLSVYVKEDGKFNQFLLPRSRGNTPGCPSGASNFLQPGGAKGSGCISRARVAALP